MFRVSILGFEIFRPKGLIHEFPGDYTEEETPDPIPNSEAKLFRPMVVRKGESRSSPGIISPDSGNCRGFPFAQTFVLTQHRVQPTLYIQNKRDDIMIELIKSHKKEIANLCNQYNVKCLELIGSALNEDDFDPQTSDIDFIVEFLPSQPRQHAKAYFKLLEKLQDLFGREIDLVEVKAITNPYLLDSINKNKMEIYAA